jgi:hypothetical protein
VPRPPGSRLEPTMRFTMRAEKCPPVLSCRPVSIASSKISGICQTTSAKLNGSEQSV